MQICPSVYFDEQITAITMQPDTVDDMDNLASVCMDAFEAANKVTQARDHQNAFLSLREEQ